MKGTYSLKKKSTRNPNHYQKGNLCKYEFKAYLITIYNDSGFQLETIKRETPLEDTMKNISGYLTLILYLEVYSICFQSIRLQVQTLFDEPLIMPKISVEKLCYFIGLFLHKKQSNIFKYFQITNTDLSDILFKLCQAYQISGGSLILSCS